MIKRNNGASYAKDQVLAVVGGGRWGRVIVSVLAKMNVPFNRVVVVSRANAQAMERLIETQQSFSSLTFNVVPSLDELLGCYNVQAAVVVNAALQHFNTSARLLNDGINVIIEKPIVLSSKHSHILTNKAITSNTCLIPGLQYRFCSYLYYFSKQISLFGKKPKTFFIDWSDQSGETRYGETKTYDPSINIAQDIMPHIWTILSTIFGYSQINVESCQVTYGGQRAEFLATMKDGMKGCITLERNANQRRRMVSIQFDSDNNLSIDFTKEPGTIFLNADTKSGDPEWELKPKPLERQLYYFLSAIAKGYNAESDIQACLESVSFSERASALLEGNRPV